MMTHDECARRVLKAIAKAQRLPLGELNAERSFVELGIGSLDAMNLVFVLEDEFGISIPEDEIAFETVGDVIDAIHKHVSDRARAESGAEPTGA